MSRLYLYGIIGSENGAAFGFAGMDGGSLVYTVAHQWLGAVVSDYEGEELATLSREKLVLRLLDHQRIAEHVMQHHTVLPVKFGTLLKDQQEALALLSQGHQQFVQALAWIQDKVEVEVAATWDTSRVLQAISREEVVVRAREAITSRGQPTVEERVRLGQTVKASMDKRREGCRERMVGCLRPLAVAVAPNALVSDEMVMNVAFLVDRARQPEFDERVLRLDELFQNEITFRVIGPLPPYSFSTVEVMRLTLQQVEEARQTLHLGDFISVAEVRRAYRGLAAQEQRSLGQGDKLARERFARLRQASELLLGYCRGRQEAQTGGDHQGPASQGSDSLFVITIRGSGGDEVEAARFGGSERYDEVDEPGGIPLLHYSVSGGAHL